MNFITFYTFFIDNQLFIFFLRGSRNYFDTLMY